LGLERGEVVSRCPRILAFHAPHWASIQELGDCDVVDSAKVFGAIHDAFKADLTSVELVEMLTNRTYGEERHRQEAAVQRLATLRQHFGGLFE
jgi:hypothetical protein